MGPHGCLYLWEWVAGTANLWSPNASSLKWKGWNWYGLMLPTNYLLKKKNESIYTKVLLINVIFFYKYSLSNYYAPNISVRSRELLMGLKQRAPLIYYKNQFILICFCRTHEMRTWGNMWCVASLLSSFREQTPGTVSIPKSYFIASGPGKQEQLNLQ